MFGKEFRIILLAAGTGSRMKDITNNKPKCLLPVGNRPLIWYPLSLLGREGFTEVTIIILDTQSNEVKKAVEKLNQQLKLTINYQTIRDRDADDFGTVSALKKVAIPGEWKEDVIILGCDIITDQSLKEILDLHRTKGSGITAFLFPSIPDAAPVPGQKSKNKPDRDLVVLDKDKRLLMLTSAMDHEESMKLRMRLLRKFGSIEIKSRLTDGHIYILNNRVWNYIISEENEYVSLKGETVPYVLKQQTSRQNKLVEKQMKPKISDRMERLSLSHHDDVQEEEEETHTFFKHFLEDKLQSLVDLHTEYSDHPGSALGPYHRDRLRCFAFIAPTGSSWKVNTIHSYCEANRHVLSTENWNQLNKGVQMVRVDPSCTSKTKKIEVSIVGANSQIGESVKIERSVIGSNCVIEQGAVLSGCFILDGVTIKEGSVLTDCLISDKAVVGKSCNLKQCLVESKFSVDEKTECDFKVFSSQLMSTDE